MIEAGRQQGKRRGAVRGDTARMRHAMAAAFLFFTATLFSALPAQAAAKVSATLSEQGGYARIILTWPGAVPSHTEAMTSSVLVVTFDKPFTADTDEFLRQMPNTVALARQDGNGRTLRLALKTEFWMNVRQAENSLYIDLLPSSWSGAPPPLPADVIARMAAAAAAKAQAAAEAKLAKERGIIDPVAPLPDLSVRVARHEGITRIVFDWNQPVLYSIAQQEGSATITFDRTAKVALAPIRVDPPPYLKTISAMERDGRLSIFLKLKSGVTVTDFREDLGIVVDLKPEQTALNAVTEPKSEAPAATKPAEKASVAEASNAHAPKSILPEPAVTPIAATPPPAPAPAEVAHVPPQTVKADASPSPAAADPAADPTAPLKVAVRAANGRTDLEFPWTLPTGAAVFVRSDTLWIVFDRKASLDVSAFDPAVLKDFGTPTIVPLERGVALAIPLANARLLVGAMETGTAWRVSLADTLTSTGRPIALTRSWSADGEGAVTLDLAGPRDILQVADPVVRDTLMVATARGPIQSVQSPRSFIEFQVLKTAQGVAIVRIADDLNVAAAPDAVVVSRHEGLALSADNEGAPASRVAGNAVVSPAKTDFAAWRGTGLFIVNRQAHLKRIIMSPLDERAAARVAFAKFLLANGMGPEGLTQLVMAMDDERKIGDDAGFRALRAVGEVIAGRNAQAVADLSNNTFEMDPTAAIWRGLAQSALGRMQLANKDFERAGPVIDTLEPALAQKAHLRAAEAALAMKNIDGARNHMSRLPPALADKHEQAFALVMGARILAALDKPIEADASYRDAIAVNDPAVNILARFEKADLLNSVGKLSDDKLVEELTKLRMAWRGDDLERRILTRLSELLLKKGDVVEALGAMRVAATNFPDSDEAHALGARMPDIFADYFIGKGSEELTPVQALAFYYNFQDLTPIGQKGDELIRHLAERLVSIDLLAQAEVLLRYQVEQRLYGSVAKAQVAARLAGVYLLDGKPRDALQIIRATAQNQMPEEIDVQRRLLEARALASLKQYDLALDLLSEIPGASSEKLRADIFWEAQRWGEAGQAARVLADASDAAGKPGAPLSSEGRFEVMRSAIAYSLADDDEGLAHLRETYAARMADTPEASGFAIVSDPIERSGVAFRDLASRIASVNMMERFVASLKSDTAAPRAKAAQAAPAAARVAVN